jgi:hypothetical protein
VANFDKEWMVSGVFDKNGCWNNVGIEKVKTLKAFTGHSAVW